MVPAGAPATGRGLALPVLLRRVFVGIIAAAIGLYGLAVWQSRGSHLRRADAVNLNLAAAHAALVSYVVLDIDRLLTRTAAAFQADIRGGGARALSTEVFRARHDALAPLRAVFAFDRDGREIASSRPVPPGVSASDSSFFSAHKEGAATGLLITGPQRGLLEDDRVVFFSRRLTGRAGEFAGVTAASVPLKALTALLEPTDAADRHRASLWLLDGRLLVAVPGDPGQPDRRIADPAVARAAAPEAPGTLRGISPLTGEDSLFALRRIPGLPLVVRSSIGTRDALAQWRRETAASGGILLALLGGLLLAYRLLERSSRKLRVRESQLETLVEHLPAMVNFSDTGGVLRYCNAAFAASFGLRSDEIIGRSVKQMMGAALTERLMAVQKRVFSGETVRYERAHHTDEGRTLDVIVAPVRPAGGAVSGLVALLIDVTERKRAELELRRLNRTYAMLSAINELIVREREPVRILGEACRIAVERGGFALAWIGLAEEGSGGLRRAAEAGSSPAALSELDAARAGSARGCAFTRQAMRDGTPAVCNDIEHDALAAPWREAALRHGYRAMASFALRVAGRPAGVYNLYADTAGFFDAEEIHLLDELARDIAFALETCDLERERLRTEKALAASEERFSKAFEYSPMSMRITRVADGLIYAVNRADAELFGHAPEDQVGRTAAELGFWLSAEDRRRYVAQFAGTDRVFGYDTRMRRKDGRVIDVRLWSVRVELDGEACLLTSTLNVSERRRQEALLAEIVGGVAGDTGQRFFDSLAHHLARATGARTAFVAELAGADELRTLALHRHGRPAAPQRFPLAGTPCAAVIESGRVTTYTGDLATRFAARSPLVEPGTRALMGAPLLDPLGKVLGVVGIASHDAIDELDKLEAPFRIFAARAQAELARMQRDRQLAALNQDLDGRVRARTEELAAANAELAAANQELEAFSYSVSHDLKAPLRAIEGFARLLLDKPGAHGAGDAGKYLSRIVANAGRMGELIDDLLELAHVGRGSLAIETVDLSRLAAEVLEALRGREPGRAVHVDVRPGIACRGDPRLLRVMLENLLGNAWKFTGRTAAARIEFGTETPADGVPVCFVRDNGAGFDPRYAERMFAPFQRFHGAEEFPGTGVGLAIVRRIVARHRSRVWGESAPGQGATFRFQLWTPLSAGNGGPAARAS